LARYLEVVKNMSFFRKMALVPVDNLKIKQHATAEKPKPYARAVNTQGEHMKQLMYDTTLDPATLAMLLQQATRKYLHFQRSRPTDYPAAASAALQSALTPASTPPTSKHTTPHSSRLSSAVTSESDEDDVFLPAPEATPQRRHSDDGIPRGSNKLRRGAVRRRVMQSPASGIPVAISRMRTPTDAISSRRTPAGTRAAFVRSRAATSGRVVAGRPSTAEALRRSTLRSWKQL
jgi:hypothetical protein